VSFVSARGCSQKVILLLSVGPPGIEPGLNAPHALVLPVYYGPIKTIVAELRKNVFRKLPIKHVRSPLSCGKQHQYFRESSDLLSDQKALFFQQ
jgi:hypothetical protein